MKRTIPHKKTRRMPSQERAQAVVSAILEAAARILERDGLGPSFGTNRIAREAGVSIGSLYEYFDGKDAIVRALCTRHVASVRAFVDEAFETLHHAPISQAVDTFVEALFALHTDRPVLHQTLHLELPTRLGLAPFIESDKYIEERLAAWLAIKLPEVPSEAIRARAFVATRATRAVSIHAIAEGTGEEERARIRRETKALLLHTLTREPTPE